MKESKERMPLDERQGHTTRLQPGRRPTFAVVEGRNPFTHCDTIKDQQSGIWDATHKAWHVRFSPAFIPQPAPRCQPSVPQTTSEVTMTTRHVVTLPTETDYSRRYDRQPWHVTIANDTEKETLLRDSGTRGALEALKWGREAAEQIIITSCKHWPS